MIEEINGLKVYIYVYNKNLILKVKVYSMW